MAELIKPWSVRLCDDCGSEFHAARQFQVVWEEGVPFLCAHCDGDRRGVASTERRSIATQRIVEAARACCQGFHRNPCGTHGISNGTVCNFCECQPHNCGCVAGELRRAIEAHDKGSE